MYDEHNLKCMCNEFELNSYDYGYLQKSKTKWNYDC